MPRETRMAAPVSFIRLILSWPRWDGLKPVPIWYKGSRDPATSSRSKPVRAQAPPNPKETMMRFYTNQHQFYCGIDLHARLLAVCIVDQAGNIVLQKQIGRAHV